MLYAIGAGPQFEQISKQYLKTVLNWADLITVRDSSSAAFLESVNQNIEPRVTADLAINYVLKNTYSSITDSNTNKKNVGICLRNWFLKDNEREQFARCFANMANNLIGLYGYKSVLFPFNKSKSDNNLLKSVYQNINSKHSAVIKKDMSRKDTVNLLQQMDFVVGMRLHSLVITASNFIPKIGISYDNKVSSFMSLLEMKNYSLSLEEVNTHSLIRRADALISDKLQIKKSLENAINQLKKKEEENAALAIQLMRRGIQ